MSKVNELKQKMRDFEGNLGKKGTFLTDQQRDD